MNNRTANLTSPLCPYKTAISIWYTIFFTANMVLCSLVIICHRSNLLYFGVYLVGTAPQIFTCESFYGDAGAEIVAYGNSITFMCIASSILLIAVNRYLAICLPAVSTVAFTGKKTSAFCMATWILGVLSILVNRLTSCVARFLESSPSFYTRCSSSLMPTIGPLSMYVYLCTYGTVVFYTLCVIQLKKQSSKVVHEVVANVMFKRQVHVFKQAISISLSMVTTLTTFRLLPYIDDMYVRFLFNNIFGLCCIYSTPLIVLLFSSKVRANMRILCGKKNVINSETSMVIKNAAMKVVPLSTK